VVAVERHGPAGALRARLDTIPSEHHEIHGEARLAGGEDIFRLHHQLPARGVAVTAPPALHDRDVIVAPHLLLEELVRPGVRRSM